jgi:hypothetical protein
MPARILLAAALAALAIAAYLPAVWQPYIADDYVQIELARRWGAVSAWPSLMADALYRCRATSLVLTWWTERLFGAEPAVFYWSAISLHVLNTWLVALLGIWPVIGWRISIPAAAFFAVAECHNEAVMWYAALPELLVFFFVLLCVHAWAFWLRSRYAGWFLAAFTAFALALLSKESAAVLPALLAIPLVARREWRNLLWLAPFFAVDAFYAWGIFAAKADHLHLNDGTFSLHAPVLVTLRNSMGRLLWVWGFLALLVVARRRLAHWSLLWMALAFLPYSFLTYMPRVPSRHTYLASAGLAVLVGLAWTALRERKLVRGFSAVAVALLVLGANVGLLWGKKRGQFLERAQPTEALVAFARRHPGEIHLRCFPYAQDVAVYAMKMAGQSPDRLILHSQPPHNAADFCWTGSKPPAAVADASPSSAAALVSARPVKTPAAN